METVKVTFKMKKNVFDRFELLHKELGGTKKDLFHEFNVDNDLVELGNLHYGLVSEFSHECRCNFRLVFF